MPMKKLSKKAQVLGLTLFLAVVLASMTTIVAYAANPILTRFLADPAVYYFNGKVYMYNTDDADNSGTTWDNKHWHAYSSTDLVNWTDEGQFWKVGSGGFTWASNYAWAPSAVYRNGFYYFYLPVDSLNSNSISKVGVLRCTAPTSGCSDPIGGPLLQEGVQANVGTEAIDPQIFLDDDGQAYLYFGGLGALKVVKLNSDMISLNGSITNVTATGYKESAWVHKYNGLYYLSYSTGWPGPIQYSTSTSPMGPWTFRGTILASQNTNTNHQSPLFYNGQWFLFYQRGAVSGWSNYRRNIAIDCMYYNTDGTIKQVVTTTGGVTSTSCGGTTATATPTRTATPGATTNLALGKTVTTDGAQAANPAANAVDGSTTTRWCAANGSTGHWLTVDLGSSRNLTGSEVMWEFARNYKYKVEVSTDNVNWTLKVDKTASTNITQTQTDSFTAMARYVRITVTGLTASPTTWASLYEFRVFGN